MQGSGGNNAGGGGPQRPFGRYAELNKAHARVVKERTDRSVVQLEKADRTHPAEPRGSAPAVVTGNRWVEWGRAMVDQLHGRMFGRYGAATPSPAGADMRSSVPAVARGQQHGQQPATAEQARTADVTARGRIGVETASLQEQARQSTVAARLPATTETGLRSPGRHPDAGAPMIERPHSPGVDFVYDRLNRVAALKGAAVGELATKELATAFRGADLEVGNRRGVSPDRKMATAKQVQSPVEAQTKKDAATDKALGVEPGD